MNEQKPIEEKKKAKDSEQEAVTSEKENNTRNQGAWNGVIEKDGEQDTDDKDESLATDGPVSEAEAGKGADLTDTDKHNSAEKNRS